MFHIKTLELVHWDYWRRFTLPLDRQIIAIVGPNGSGKTTLLDALRTLFALRCSGKRDFRRYVRRNGRSFAWIRAVVANQPGQSGKRPFFPCLADEVTLACRIRKAAGDWTRDYTIFDGNLAIETLENTNEWTGLRDYQNRLAWGGLTPAIAKVLSLEQGDTDKLCEYSPKALLELVFDVFGDKEVLDNYDAAREEQKNAESELDTLGLELDRLRAKTATKRLDADRYLEWKQLSDEIHALKTEIIPRLEVYGLQCDAFSEREQLIHINQERLTRQAERHALRAQLEPLQAERDATITKRNELKTRRKSIDEQHLNAHDHVRDLEKRLAERDTLRTQLASEHGIDALNLEKEHEEADAIHLALRRQERELIAAFEEKTTQLRNARTRTTPPADKDVTYFRTLLDEAGIAHQSLAEVIEITDPAWQGALEAVLRPYRHVILLQCETDRHVAWTLGERERFRHFIVHKREHAAPAIQHSLAEIVHFNAPIPRWLTDLLNRIRRVDSVDDAQHLPKEMEWITRDGYHRERRGARHLGRPNEFHFGDLARQSRIKTLEYDITALDQTLQALRPQLDNAARRVQLARTRLLGLQSAQLLAANANQYAEAEADLLNARAALERIQTEQIQLQTTTDTLNETLHGIEIEQDRRKREIKNLEQRLADLSRNHTPRRHHQAERLWTLRRLRRSMPAHWLTPEAQAELIERYGDTRNARLQQERLTRHLEDSVWVTDPTVLPLCERLNIELKQRENDYLDRQAYCATARRHTDEARNAYIAKLRATVRQYGKNLRSLGALAHVHVECVLPLFDNDARSLQHSGLDVKFNFDQKGAVGLNDGEASGGQQVMKSLILLIALLMDEARPGGFVFIDEPFAHLDIANIERVGAFLRATQAQYLITTPVTHNANVFAPTQLTLITRKKVPSDDWAPPIGILQRLIE